MPVALPPHVLGLAVNGDLDGTTLYTDRRGRVTHFLKTHPHKPASPRQSFLRTRFKLAQAFYMALTPAEKEAWEDLARVSSIPMTGQNAYIHFAMKHDLSTLEALKEQTNVDVDTPPLV